MKRWLPSGYISACCLCDDEGEADGYVIFITWGSFIFELSFAWRA